MSDFGDYLGEIIDLFVNTVDLFKDILCFGRRKITPALALEESDAKRFLRVFHQPANTRCCHIKKLGRAANGACHHDRPDNLDLAQRHHLPQSPDILPGAASAVARRHLESSCVKRREADPLYPKIAPI